MANTHKQMRLNYPLWACCVVGSQQMLTVSLLVLVVAAATLACQGAPPGGSNGSAGGGGARAAAMIALWVGGACCPSPPHTADLVFTSTLLPCVCQRLCHPIHSCPTVARHNTTCGAGCGTGCAIMKVGEAFGAGVGVYVAKQSAAGLCGAIVSELAAVTNIATPEHQLHPLPVLQPQHVVPTLSYHTFVHPFILAFAGTCCCGQDNEKKRNMLG